MAKVVLTLESSEVSAEDLEKCLDALRPVLAIMTPSKVHVIVQEED